MSVPGDEPMDPGLGVGMDSAVMESLPLDGVAEFHEGDDLSGEDVALSGMVTGPEEAGGLPSAVEARDDQVGFVVAPPPDGDAPHLD